MPSRVSLRIATPDDADALFALLDGSRDALGQWLPWVDATRSAADVAAWIIRVAAARAAGSDYAWLIEVDGDIAGVSSLNAVSRLNRHAGVAYWLGDRFVGHGYLPLALQQVLDFAFGELALNRVELVAAAANLRSCAVAERSGFRLEGVLRGYLRVGERFWDARIYSLLASEWQAGGNGQLR